tara:strand:- start:468 stop:653 length:186 start_codon:yes stop_codon:yes gene_type:complete
MAEEDLKKFIKKVDQLNKMVNSLEKFPGRRKQLADCSSHEQVVELAKSWGFLIGKRWGEES